MDLDKLKAQVEKIEISEIPLAQIYLRKKKEVLNKIELLKAFKEQRTKDIAYYSEKVF